MASFGSGDSNISQGGWGERAQAMAGNPLSSMEHRHTWERAVVQCVYPDKHSCDVYTERGKYLAGVSWPDGGEKVPRRGDIFHVHFQIGKPVLVSTNTDAKQPSSDQESHHVSPVEGVGGEDEFYANKGQGKHRGERPRDLLPGDWVKLGSMGNLVGVLEGGTTVIKASDLAQIIATQAKHLLRLVGKNIKMDTGAGTLDFKTENGKSTINLYAGADEETESSPTAENFRIRCELGSDGELVDFRVTDHQGRSVYRVHVDPDGRVQKKSRRETSIIEEDKREEVGSHYEEIIGGNKTSEVAGSKTENISGSVTQKSGGSYQIQAAKSAAYSAMQDLMLTANRNIAMSAGGALNSADPSLGMDVVNGDFVIDIGNPVKGDAQIAMSGLSVDTFTGDIELSSQLGNFKVNTNLPNSVKLGGPGPGIFSALLYEVFSTFMELFGTLIDTHVHPVPAAGGAPTGPPSAPPWSSSRALFKLSKSRFVKLGG